VPFVFRTLHAWVSDLSYRFDYMIYHLLGGDSRLVKSRIAVNGYRAYSHYGMDRDDSRDTRPEGRSHFFNFGGPVSPNEAGRNCLHGSFMGRYKTLGKKV